MIIWKRLGILGVIIPFGLGLLFSMVFENTNFNASIGGIIGAVIVWFLGNKLNTNPESGQKLAHANAHTLFYIKMEIWGILFGFVGITTILSGYINYDLSKITYPIVLIIGVILIYMGRKKDKESLRSSPPKGVNEFQTKKNETKIDKYSFSNRDKSKKEQTKNIERNKSLAENEFKNKELYDELRNNRNKEIIHKPTDHSNYLPKRHFIGEEE